MAERYERLSAQDSTFLMFEHRPTPMHVAAVSVFDARPLKTELGGIDVERILKYTESRLHLLARYRQKIQYTPLGNPVWVDDLDFDLRFHVRHTSLPRPGLESGLKSLVGRLLSQHLDRSRPLWEMWIVEGLEDDRFAIVSKVHHCMVDGAAGVNLLSLMMSPSRDARIEPAPAWHPRSTPAPAVLAVDEVLARARIPLDLLRSARSAYRDPRAAVSSATEGAKAAWAALRDGLRAPAETPLNRPIGHQRRMEWCELDLQEAKSVRHRLGGTVNDVVLATVAGALRRFLAQREFELEGADFKVMIPVNMRSGADDMSASNNVSGVFLSLPVAEPDPRKRFEKIREATAGLKRSRAASGIELFTKMVDRSRSRLLARLGVRLASSMHPYNLIVTNVPGPQTPFYLLGARLLAVYPQVPLFNEQALGVGVMSYHGRLFFGLVGDRWEVPDLATLGYAVEDSFRELLQIASEASAARVSDLSLRSLGRGRGLRVGSASQPDVRDADQHDDPCE
jgi:WS/DGAT/MGAT family acyltransferase